MRSLNRLKLMPILVFGSILGLTAHATETPVSASYVVTLPASVSLAEDINIDDYTKSGNYSISVNGNIDDDKYVVVTPYESSALILKDSANNSASTKIIQEEVCWSKDDANSASSKDGQIYASIDAPGNYKGDAQFTFYLSDDYVKTDYHSHLYTKTLTKVATCTEDGEYSYMCRCGEVMNTESIPAIGHTYEDTVIPSTCKEKGYTLHKCSVCGNEYKDTYTDLSDNHTFGETDYEWTTDGLDYVCTATRICSICGYEETESVTAVAKETKKATCSEMGEITYTATFKNTAFEEQTTSEFTNTVDEHNYKETIYTWSTDHLICTASRTCADCNETEVENAKATKTIISTASCIAEGEVDYIAVFDNTDFEIQTYKEMTPKTEHEYEDTVIASTLSSSGYTLHTCKNCGYSYTDNETPVKVLGVGIFDKDGNSLTDTEITADMFSSNFKRAKNFISTLGIDVEDVAYVNFPAGVTRIGAYTLYACPNLIAVTIPDGCTTIAKNAFEECTSLTTVNMPNTITYIGVSAFAECTSLTSITLSSSLETIQDDAFGDTGLTEITIPATVTTLNQIPFEGSPLTRVIFEDPNGWYVTDTDDEIIEITLSDPETNAILVNDTYTVGYTWNKYTE